MTFKNYVNTRNVQMFFSVKKSCNNEFMFMQDLL